MPFRETSCAFNKEEPRSGVGNATRLLYARALTLILLRGGLGNVGTALTIKISTGLDVVASVSCVTIDLNEEFVEELVELRDALGELKQNNVLRALKIYKKA